MTRAEILRYAVIGANVKYSNVLKYEDQDTEEWKQLERDFFHDLIEIERLFNEELKEF